RAGRDRAGSAAVLRGDARHGCPPWAEPTAVATIGAGTGGQLVANSCAAVETASYPHRLRHSAGHRAAAGIRPAPGDAWEIPG
ncbi:MAG: hypothetical protein ABJD68_06530, partial [Nakamurella sp.]